MFKGMFSTSQSARQLDLAGMPVPASLAEIDASIVRDEKQVAKGVTCGCLGCAKAVPVPAGAKTKMYDTRRICSVLVGLLGLMGQASAQGFYGDKKYGEYYEEEQKWVEQEAALPDFPREQALIEFDAGAATSNRYYIDGATLSTGGDGVVRYVVVIKGGMGATNVIFEGIRCSTRERKQYALGRADMTWSSSRAASWRPIVRGSYQAVLSKEYFCPNGIAILKAEEGVSALMNRGHPEAR